MEKANTIQVMDQPIPHQMAEQTIEGLVTPLSCYYKLCAMLGMSLSTDIQSEVQHFMTTKQNKRSSLKS